MAGSEGRPDVFRPVFQSEESSGLAMDWIPLLKETVDDVFKLFSRVLAYSYTLPDRIWAEAF